MRSRPGYRRWWQQEGSELKGAAEAALGEEADLESEPEPKMELEEQGGGDMEMWKCRKEDQGGTYGWGKVATKCSYGTDPSSPIASDPDWNNTT